MRLSEIQAGGGGALGGVLRVVLHGLSAGWWTGLQVRRGLAALGYGRPRSLPRPVVSIGNLAVGGTGKTPFTAWLAAGLRARGHHPGILSRGYGPKAAGDDADLSDEGAVLRHLLGRDVQQVEAADRVAGGARLLEAHPDTDVFLLDDGFQHRRLARDLDVVLLDATRPFGYGHLLPRGLLREPPRALARAGVVVLTRAERADEEAVEGIRGRVGALTPAPLVVTRTRPQGVVLRGEQHPPEWLLRRRVFVACGIGNPDAFTAQLEDLGAVVVGRRFFADHAAPSEAAWTQVREKAWEAHAELVVTTRKDAVKLEALAPDVGVLDVGMVVESGADALWTAVEGVFAA